MSVNKKTMKEALQLEAQLRDMCVLMGMKYCIADLTSADYYTNICKVIAVAFYHQATIMMDPLNGTYI